MFKADQLKEPIFVLKNQVEKCLFALTHSQLILNFSFTAVSSSASAIVGLDSYFVLE